MRSKEIRNRKKYVAFLLVLMLSAFLSVTVQAAWRSYLWAGDAPVKAGGKWFRSENQEMDGEWGTRIEVSAKSKKSGYKTILEGKDVGNAFVTDGKNVYYLENNILKVCAVRSKKKTTLKKLPLPTKNSYYTLGGYFNGKIWFVAREEKFIGKAMVSWNVKTRKLKTEKKNFLIWNTPVISRYVVMTTGTKKMKDNGSLYTLKVLDRNTGKYTTMAKNVRPMVYAAGGAYDTMAKWFIYGEYDDDSRCWQIKQYTFKTKKTIVLKTLEQGREFASLMYTGSGVAIMEEGSGEFKQENMIKAK